MKVIIIEDESLIAEALAKEILKVDDTIEIMARLSSIQKSIDYLEHHEAPDLFFSDIELSDGLSFEIFKHTKNIQPIVFCTAYDQYALEAFKACGIDYILKPFKSEDISATIKKYYTFFANKTNSTIDFNTVFQLIENRNTANKNSVLVHKGDKIIPINISNIALVQLSNGVVYINTFDRLRYTINYSMDYLSQLLGYRFFRVNRQFIINRNAVKSASQHFARKLIIHPTITFEEKLIVSKANASHFLRWLESQ